MLEPFASDRLRRVLDAQLPSGAAPHDVSRARRGAALESISAPADLLAALEPEPVPSPALSTAIAACTACAPAARCERHEQAWLRERWDAETTRHALGERFADGYGSFRDDALTSEPVAAAYLDAMRTLSSAVAQVWEAHALGAITLPPGVLDAVRAARRLDRGAYAG